MKFPFNFLFSTNWKAMLFLWLLSLAGLTSATGDKAEFTIGFRGSLDLPSSSQPSRNNPQPQIELPSFQQFKFDFIIQSQTHEFGVAIMPLHLLGKKSWNVYNASNISKVRADEARAKAIEDAADQRTQEQDAARRIQYLRGEIPTPLPPSEDEPSSSSRSKRDRDEDGTGRDRKRRKRAGENDTDFEMRIAQENQVSAEQNGDRQLVLRRDVAAPVTDQRGNIDLFPQSQPSASTTKNPEVEREKERKRKEYEDQYTMRFSNAAGFRQGLEDPWYSKKDKEEAAEDKVGKDVWGNEDPRRRDRERERMMREDPMSMMKMGAEQIRAIKAERKRAREEREKEMKALEDEEKGKLKRRRTGDAGELEGFRLDDEGERDKEKKHRHRSRSERHRSRSERGRTRHRSRSPRREESRRRSKYRD